MIEHMVDIEKIIRDAIIRDDFVTFVATIGKYNLNLDNLEIGGCHHALTYSGIYSEQIFNFILDSADEFKIDIFRIRYPKLRCRYLTIFNIATSLLPIDKYQKFLKTYKPEITAKMWEDEQLFIGSLRIMDEERPYFVDRERKFYTLLDFAPEEIIEKNKEEIEILSAKYGFYNYNLYSKRI